MRQDIFRYHSKVSKKNIFQYQFFHMMLSMSVQCILHNKHLLLKKELFMCMDRCIFKEPKNLLRIIATHWLASGMCVGYVPCWTTKMCPAPSLLAIRCQSSLHKPYANPSAYPIVVPESGFLSYKATKCQKSIVTTGILFRYVKTIHSLYSGITLCHSSSIVMHII